MKNRTEVSEPTVYVIAGPNGAGKTTFATKFLPKKVKCREFLNADLIAAGLSPFAPQTQDIRAARLLLERIDELTNLRADFGFETTLSGRTYLRKLTEMKNYGYRVVLFFLWLPDAEVAVARVAGRVRQGGHNVPESDIRRRYVSGLRNLFFLYRPIVDEWDLYDASKLPPTLIASDKSDVVKVRQKRLFEKIEALAREPSDENSK
jgi:predicted ABC-type ATPase